MEARKGPELFPTACWRRGALPLLLPSSGNRNAPSRIFSVLSWTFYFGFVCLFGVWIIFFFSWPFSTCLCPRVCPSLSPPPRSELFRILSWLCIIWTTLKASFRKPDLTVRSHFNGQFLGV